MGERRTRKSSEIKERETGRETKSRQQKKGHKEMEKRESKKEIHGETKIQAYGDGIAEMNINYCPECGRKLEED